MNRRGFLKRTARAASAAAVTAAATLPAVSFLPAKALPVTKPTLTANFAKVLWPSVRRLYGDGGDLRW